MYVDDAKGTLKREYLIWQFVQFLRHYHIDFDRVVLDGKQETLLAANRQRVFPGRRWLARVLRNFVHQERRRDESRRHHELDRPPARSVNEGDGVIDISIESIEAGEQVRIQIADSGEGIAEGEREKITDPFYTTKDVGEGSGLGLWVTLGIVHRHGGQLACKSEPGNGAVFTVTLPVSPG